MSCLIVLQRLSEVTNKTNAYLLLGVGVAGGAFLGRFLPVLFANASGLAQGAAGRDPFAGLIKEHRTLLSLLDKMEHLPATAWAKRKLLFLAFKRKIGKHAMAEEDIIYPLLKTQAERHEATQKLYREHASMKIHLCHRCRGNFFHALTNRYCEGLHSAIQAGRRMSAASSDAPSERPARNIASRSCLSCSAIFDGG